MTLQSITSIRLIASLSVSQTGRKVVTPPILSCSGNKINQQSFRQHVDLNENLLFFIFLKTNVLYIIRNYKYLGLLHGN